MSTAAKAITAGKPLEAAPKAPQPSDLVDFSKFTAEELESLSTLRGGEYLNRQLVPKGYHAMPHLKSQANWSTKAQKARFIEGRREAGGVFLYEASRPVIKDKYLLWWAEKETRH
jgi:hypothetical protein